MSATIGALQAANSLGELVPATTAGNSNVSSILSDDPTNAWGMGAPAVIRGSIFIPKLSGINLGSSIGTADQTANGTILQTAFTQGVTNGKWFECDDRNIEFYNTSGLVFPWGHGPIRWRGSKSVILEQFAVGPGIVFGYTAGGSNLINNVDIDGMGFRYSVAQGATATSIAFGFGNMAQGSIKNLYSYASSATFAPYYCFYDYIGMFQMNTAGFGTQFAQQDIYHLANSGSGNTYVEHYLTDGQLDNPGTLAGSAINYANGGNCDHWDRVNVEGVKANRVIAIQNGCRGLKFTCPHLETVSLTGANPVMFFAGTGWVSIRELWADFRCTTADGASGIGSVYQTYSSDNVLLDGVNLLSQSTDTGGVTLPFRLNYSVGETPDTPPTFEARGVKIFDANGGGIENYFYFDDNLPFNTNRTVVQSGTYRYGLGVSRTDGVIYNVIGSYTHQGCEANSVLLVPAALAANTVITLAQYLTASGTGSTTPVPIGQLVTVRFQGGTNANTATVYDQKTGTTIYTRSSAGVTQSFQFTSGGWALA